MEQEKQKLDYIQMSVRKLVVYLSDSGISYEKIAKLWGVSKLQVFYYGKGVTKKPGVKVAMRIYENTSFEGTPVVLEGYANLEHLKASYEMFQKGL